MGIWLGKRLLLLALAGCTWVAHGLSPPARTPDERLQDARRRMVAAVEADAQRWPAPGLGARVREALLTVPRHEFVPAAMRSLAYANTPLPIGHEQTISQPTVVALMTGLLDVQPGDTVLEVGTGSGYQAAVLAELGAVVHSIEIVPGLARTAAATLARLGYDRVTVHTGDGYAGLPDLAPFAAVIVTAAPPEVPGALVAQLAPGGRLVLPVGEAHETQQLVVLTKDASGVTTTRRILPVRFVPLVHE